MPPYKIRIGKSEKPIASEWMEWKGRRSYDGIIFSPGQEKEVHTGHNGTRKTYFNLWRGFTYAPPLRELLIRLSINFLNTPGLMCAGVMMPSIDGCSDISRISFNVHGRNHWSLWSFVAGKERVRMRVSSESDHYSVVISCLPVTGVTLSGTSTAISKTV
jgi:hypothetical protein